MAEVPIDSSEMSVDGDVRMKGFRERKDVDDVLHLLDRTIRALSSVQVSILEAAGSVLARDVISEVDVPHFSRSAMDGYAVRGEETFGASDYNPLHLRVVGESLPAAPSDRVVGPGEAIRIMTGAPIPEGADAVLVAESASERERVVQVKDSVAPGRHIGRIGEDIEAGTLVLRTGRILRPQDVALLSSIGLPEIDVLRRPVVDIFTTGNELLPAGSRPTGTSIVDSNSLMIAALVIRDGGIPRRHDVVRDERDLIRDALAGSDADMVVVTGGSSVGAEDHAPTILAEIGTLSVHGIAMRPSSPTGLGFIGDRPVFLLPGNPVSCLCAYDFFAGRSVRIMGGRSPEWPHRRRRARLARKISSAVGRVDYVRVIFDDDEVVPIATSGASILSSTTRADGFVLIDRDSEGLPPGDEVEVLLYD